MKARGEHKKKVSVEESYDILGCKITIVRKEPSYTPFDIKAHFVFDRIKPEMKSEIITHGFYCAQMPDGDAFKFVSEGYGEPGSVLAWQKSIYDPWEATIFVGGVEGSQENIRAVNEGMYATMVLAQSHDYRRASVKAAICNPTTDASPLCCAIAAFRQAGGKSVSVTFYLPAERITDSQVRDFCRVIKSGRYASGACPPIERLVRIGRPVYPVDRYLLKKQL